MIRVSYLALTWLFLLTPLVGGQTFIVDDDGGPGVSFTDLPLAVASVPAGSVLRVRQGSYSGFSLTSKSLSIIGDHPALVRIVTPVTIGQTMTGGPFLLKDVTITGGMLTVEAMAISVILDHVLVYNLFPIGNLLLAVRNCPNVVMSRCEVTGIEVANSQVSMTDCFSGGQDGYQSIGGGTQGSVAGQVSSSRLLLHRTIFVGGQGGGATCCGLPAGGPGGTGGTGMILDRARVILYRGSEVRGGDGGAANQLFPMGAGGIGVSLMPLSSLVLMGSEPMGGNGSPNGSPLEIAGSSTVVRDPAARPATAELIGFPSAGQTVQLRARGVSGSLALLVVGNTPQHVGLEPLSNGSVLLAPLAVAGPFTVPASGVLDIPFPVTMNTPVDEVYLGQFLTLEPGTNALWATNPILFLVKS